MTTLEPRPTAQPPQHPSFQFSLRTLLLLFVVLASSLAVFGVWGIAVFAVAVVLAVWLRKAVDLRPLLYLTFALASLMVIAVVVGRFLQAFDFQLHHGRSCEFNLKWIALALREYEVTFGCLPPTFTTDKTGKPAASWRALLLPYLEDECEYAGISQAIAQGTPWKTLSAKRIGDYVCPSDPSKLAGPTSYLAVVGMGAAWSGDKPRKLVDFGEHAHTTITVIEVHDSGISWAEPNDLSVDALGADAALPSRLTLPSNHDNRDDFFFIYDPAVNVIMADFTVRSPPLGNRSTDEWRSVLQIGGCKEDEVGETMRRPNWTNIAALAVWLVSVGTLLACAVRSRKAASATPATLEG